MRSFGSRPDRLVKNMQNAPMIFLVHWNLEDEASVKAPFRCQEVPQRYVKG